MARSRKMKRSTRRKVRRTGRTKRAQQRGGAYGYSASAFSTPGGVAVENRASYDHCYGDMRPAPAVTPTGAMQAGGACNTCGFPQVGGGSGTGGYGFQLDNSLGKVYAELPKGPCLQQTGGAAAEEYGIVSYPSGYGFDKAHAVVTPSAMYLDPVRYDRTCQGGGRRKVRRTGRQVRSSGRKTRRSGRKH